jgi:signal-transduction protein with cAMP-binding, CBS, and nucleotidyltransferase domain
MSATDKLKILVQSVMRSPAVSVQFSDTVASIAEKMASYDIGAVVVTSGGTPTGIVTEKDIVSKVVRMNRDPSKTLAKDVMSSPLTSIETTKSLSDAIKTMKEKNVRRIIATEGGRVVGIVTERRILEFLAGL